MCKESITKFCNNCNNCDDLGWGAIRYCDLTNECVDRADVCDSWELHVDLRDEESNN